MYTSPKDYDSTLKLIRNIVIVDIKDIYTKGTFKYAKDVYASPLTVHFSASEEVDNRLLVFFDKLLKHFFVRSLNGQYHLWKGLA